METSPWVALITAGVVPLVSVVLSLVITSRNTSRLAEAQTDLQRSLHDYQVQSSWLHRRQAQVIEGLYSRLVETVGFAEAAVSPVKGGTLEDEQKLFDDTDEKLRGFYRFFARNRLYLDPGICDSVETLLAEIRSAVRTVERARYVQTMGISAVDHTEDWEKAWKRFGQEAPILTKQLEARFRKLLQPVAD